MFTGEEDAGNVSYNLTQFLSLQTAPEMSTRKGEQGKSVRIIEKCWSLLSSYDNNTGRSEELSCILSS